MTATCLVLLKRNPTLSEAEWKDIYENHHIPLSQNLMGSAFPQTHAIYYIDRSNKDAFLMGSPDDIDYDAITMLTFPDMEQLQAGIAKAGEPDVAKEINEGQARLFDLSKMKFIIVGEHSSIHRRL